MAVMQSILSAVATHRPLLAVLLDPDKPFRADLFASVQPDLILVGGSTGNNADQLVRRLKQQLSIPVVLFPGNVAQFTPAADALLFLSVLSSDNPDFLVGNQIKAAASVHASGIESIPMGYILVDGGRTTSVQRATGSQPIPRDNIRRITDTAIAAELLGKQLVYLEAGSGAAIPVAPETIAAVRRQIRVPLIVGGGIGTVQQMQDAFRAGADIVVIGNHFEQHPEQLKAFVEGARSL